MSFFSSLFSGRFKTDIENKEEILIDEIPSDFPELYKGMTINVLTVSGDTLLSGRLTSFSSSELTVERLPGCISFDVVPIGTSVTAIGYSKKMIPFCIKASIKESSRIMCQLTNLTVQTFSEQRLSFRLPLHAPATLYYQSDEFFKNPEECMLVDISTGGACIESEYLHAEDEVLRLKIKIDEYKPMDFMGQIIRVLEYAPGKFRYGFLFAQLKEDEITELTRTLYNIQIGNKKEWSRGESGAWS